MIKNRYLKEIIVEDLADKMVFVGGPRQVGKTTLSTDIVSRHFKSYGYFNWDNRHDRKKIMASEWPGDAELLILDEIHKYKKWKTLLKGEYDKLKHVYKFLVTGSSQLDIYRRGGDSLQGRRFTAGEAIHCRAAIIIFVCIHLAWLKFLKKETG